MDRRRFFKVTAITGTTAALASCGNPENQIVRFIPDEELTPGIAVWKPSVCPLCAAGCGVTARVMDGDAEVFRNGQPGVTRMGLVKKLEGDPEHPLSKGRLCVRGQAAVQVTYHPDRLVAPQRRNGERGSGQFTEISWDEALKTLVERLDAAAAAGPRRWRFCRGPAVAAGTSWWPSSCVASARRRRSASRSSTTRCCAAPTSSASAVTSCPRSTSRAPTTCSTSAPTCWAPGTRRWRTAWPTAPCARDAAAAGRSSCRSSRGCHRPVPAPTSGWRCGRAPKARWPWAWRMS